MNPLRIFRVIGELIGRVKQTVTTYLMFRRPWRSTVDRTKADYEFYDKARRGLARGLEISGLLLKPVASKTASWVMGRPVQWKVDNENEQTALNDWFQKYHADIMFAFEEAVALSDYYLVVNPDGSLIAIPPHVVTEIVADDDYGSIIGYRVTQRFDHPEEIGKYMIEINEYYADKRVQIIEFENQKPQTYEFPNPIGRLPIIRLSNNRKSNQVFGEAEGAALVATSKSVLHRYGEVIDAGLDGHMIMGRPTPVASFKDAAAMQKFYDTYIKSETKTLADGTTETVYYFDFDPSQLFTVAGDFKYAQPGAFAGETEKLLSILYWIFLEYVEIPEFVMGTAIQGSRASADTQMPIFVRWIEKKRAQVRSWIIELAEVVSAMQSLLTPGIRAFDASAIKLVWEDLTDDDGKLTLDALRWAFAEGLIDRETALQLAPLDVDDIQSVLKKAKEERDEARDEMEARFERQLADGRGNEDEDEDGQDDQIGKAA